MRLLVDVGPLRESPAFRRLWIGSTLSGVGTMMTSFAVTLQVWTLTHSSVAVGAIGLALAVPSIAFGLFGGAIADAVDRRRLVLLTSAALALVSGLLALQAFLDLRQVWLLYCLVAVQSLFGAVNGPARRTFTPRLLPASALPAASALNLLTFHASITAGPSLAGVIAGAWGLRACYLADLLSFAAALYGVVRLPPMPPEGDHLRPGFHAVAESLRYIGRTRALIGAFLADANSTVLGMPAALFPAFNATHFGGSPRTLGLLAAAPAIGGLLGATLSGPVSRIARQGLAQLACGALWGAGLALFGLSRALWLAVAFLALAGAADAISVVFRTTIVQTATPDALRGRVNAADYVVGAVFPQLGNVRAGTVAALTTPAISAVTGGLAVIAGALAIGWALPAFVRYPAGTTSSPPTGPPPPTTSPPLTVSPAPAASSPLTASPAPAASPPLTASPAPAASPPPDGG